MQPEIHHEGGVPLSSGHDSLSRGVGQAVPGSVLALALGGGYRVGPREGRTVYFGRNRHLVHVCLGENDQQVSRRHGVLTSHHGHWWLRNLGRRPIRLPRDQWLFAGEDPIPLAEGYTPLHVPGTRDREHLLEIYVIGASGDQPSVRHDVRTVVPQTYTLSDEELLMLVVLGQHYLLHDPNPKPLTWHEAGSQLAALQPEAGWTPKKIERQVSKVRARLSSSGVEYLTREEVGEPVGNILNDNLLRELVRSTTITPNDLELIEHRKLTR